MPDIVLCTFNAKYAHTAFGLRCLLANLGALAERAALRELDLGQRPEDVVEQILADDPRILGIGVYIWNVEQSAQLVRLVKRLRPGIRVVAGGPEVSHPVGNCSKAVGAAACDGDEVRQLVEMVDFVVTGEGEESFRSLCLQLLQGRAPQAKLIPGRAADLRRLVLPYHLYTERDLAHRVLYVESSRGCPFGCAFCLSAVDRTVRAVPLNRFFEAMDGLLERGAVRFKLVDRTFNLSPRRSAAILRYFLDRYRPGLFVHLEVVPDRLTPVVLDLLAAFPEGSLQLEVGVQTLSPAVAAAVGRRQDNARVLDNLRWLREHTGVHLHADLIVGLPGETLQSFADGFDSLLALGPQEVQVGILKRLRGTPLAARSGALGMVFNPRPPYELLHSRDLDFAALQGLKRFARYWDLVANRGRFRHTMPLIWSHGSAFFCFLRFSDFLHRRTGQTHGIALERLAELMLEFLQEEQGLPREQVVASLSRDLQRGGRRTRLPRSLTSTPAMAASPAPEQRGPLLPSAAPVPAAAPPPRQAWHLV